jgi:hypothetical protein
MMRSVGHPIDRDGELHLKLSFQRLRQHLLLGKVGEWPTLPDPIKAAIAALIGSVKG